MNTNVLDICQINVRSLNNEKIDAIKAEMLSEYDVICLTETNLPTARVDDLNLNGFHPLIRKDRVGKTGGGVGMYIANHLGITQQFNFEIPQLEALWVKVKAGNNIVLICVCYRPPNAKAEFWTKLQDSIDIAKQSGIEKIILTGDFNADPNTREGHFLKLFTLSNNLSLHITEPTRITPTSATILDQFISNIPCSLRNVEVLDPISTCDHCPIRASVFLKHKFNKPKCYQRHIWQYNLADFDLFRQQLGSVDWNICLEGDIDESCLRWTTTFLNIARQCIPNKVVTIRPNDQLFFTPELKKEIKKEKNRMH